MTSDAYELAALTLRYVFAGLMLLIALRAGRGALTDSRRAAKLRRLSPMTGLSGELVVLEGDQRARRGMRYPVIQEGMIGSSRRADIRVRHSTVRRRHAYFQLAEDGLHVRTHAGARLRDGAGRMARELVLADGDSLYVGSVKLLLVLSVPDAPRRRAHPERERTEADQEEDALFHDGDWDVTPYQEADEEEDFPNLDEEDGSLGTASVSDERSRRSLEPDPDLRYRRPGTSGAADERSRRGLEPDPDLRDRRPGTAGASDTMSRRGLEPDPDLRYRRPGTAGASDTMSRRGLESDPDLRYRRPGTAGAADERSRRGLEPDPDLRDRRPETAGAADPGFDPDFDAGFGEKCPPRESGRNRERGAFPDGDDPFDVFLDEQDEDAF